MTSGIRRQRRHHVQLLACAIDGQTESIAHALLALQSLVTPPVIPAEHEAQYERQRAEAELDHTVGNLGFVMLAQRIVEVDADERMQRVILQLAPRNQRRLAIDAAHEHLIAAHQLRFAEVRLCGTAFADHLPYQPFAIRKAQRDCIAVIQLIVATEAHQVFRQDRHGCDTDHASLSIIQPA